MRRLDPLKKIMYGTTVRPIPYTVGGRNVTPIQGEPALFYSVEHTDEVHRHVIRMMVEDIVYVDSLWEVVGWARRSNWRMPSNHGENEIPISILSWVLVKE